MTDTAVPHPTARMAHRPWANRLAGAFVGLLIAWLALEVLMRAGYGLLPPGIRGAIENVRRMPWSHETIAPQPPWVPDRDYQNIVPPGLKDRRLYFSDGYFDITTISLWEGRVGFRSHPPQWPVDIAVVGDSFTFCFNAFADCWVQRLHSDYGWSTMNLGQRGTGSLAHLQILKTFGVPLEPRVVIWQWYGNDANEDYGMAVMRGETEPLETTPAITPKPDYGWMGTYSAVYTAFRDLWRRWTDDDSGHDSGIRTVQIHGQHLRVGDPYNVYANDLSRPANQYGWARMVEALDEAQRLVTGDMNAELVIVLMPTKEEVYADDIADDIGQDYLNMVSEGRLKLNDLCPERGWHCIDLTEPLQSAARAGREIFYSVDHHITARGNEIVTRVVAEYLIDHGLLTAADDSG